MNKLYITVLTEIHIGNGKDPKTYTSTSILSIDNDLNDAIEHMEYIFNKHPVIENSVTSTIVNTMNDDNIIKQMSCISYDSSDIGLGYDEYTIRLFETDFNNKEDSDND